MKEQMLPTIQWYRVAEDGQETLVKTSISLS